jgi:hypothetical protein
MGNKELKFTKPLLRHKKKQCDTLRKPYIVSPCLGSVQRLTAVWVNVTSLSGGHSFKYFNFLRKITPIRSLYKLLRQERH